VKKENSGFCICDIYNINKQNNGAAFHIFYSQLLEMYQDNEIINPEKLDLFVYLFILGKIIKIYLINFLIILIY
jgi:hypothetical protein